MLDKAEMLRIIEAVHQLYEGLPISKNDSIKKVETIINTFDKENNGFVSKNEFIESLSNDLKTTKLANHRQISSNSLDIRSTAN